MEPIQVQRVSSYKLTAEQAGLGVAVDPYIETSRLKAHFGADLLARRVLPVLVVLENQDADGGFALLPNRCALLTGGTSMGPGIGDPFTLQQKAEASRRGAIIGGATIMVFPLAAVAALPIVGSVQEEYRDARDMQKNMMRLALTVKPVYRGDSNSGFLYFRTEGLDLSDSDLAIQVVGENIRTKEQVAFQLRLKP